jgi:hypothetical protein
MRFKLLIILLFPLCVFAQRRTNNNSTLTKGEINSIVSEKETQIAATYLAKPVITTSNNNNPTGTTSTTGVMAGLAKSFTPTVGTRALIIVSGQATNNTGDAGFKYDLRYGTGAAPANAAALTGTQIGSTITGSAVASGSTNGVPIMPFITHGVITGLTPGTAYWFDLGQYVVGSGTVTFSSINVTVIEL